MATETPHKQEFRIRDLATRSVTLFPSRAQIIRDINNVSLKPGANQIIIDGLAPTVDEHSIKVEGTGAATITDVTVDRLPNREVYEDIYPEGSDDESDESDDNVDKVLDNPELQALDKTVKELGVRLLEQNEVINSAAHRLKICDAFGTSVERNRPSPSDLESLLQAYQDERKKIYADHEKATSEKSRIEDEILRNQKKKREIVKAILKAREKEEKEKAKLKEKKLRQKAEMLKEKQRIKTERESFWPKEVYRITINLEPTSFTPAVSRRSSLDGGDTVVNLSTSDFHEPSSTPLKTDEISLSLSYITYSASWAPRYNLNLDSVKKTGTLEYGAELTNTTSEIWRDTRIILSTSQTTFSGLSETIPLLLPWHVRLQRGGAGAEEALFSKGEVEAKRQEWSKTQGASNTRPRHQDFGRDDASYQPYIQQHKQQVFARRKMRDAAVEDLVQPGQPAGSGGPRYFGAAASFASVPQPQSMTMPQAHYRTGGHRGFLADVEADEESSNGDMGFALFDDGVPSSSRPQALTFEEGDWDENGLTTTYDIPAQKTLAPSNSTVKHKIAKIEFRNVIFSHIIIGKLRQVAFLKARLRNNSKVTLLKGPLGLTLDGSFLGQATFPRCSVGESFSLPLGVDPAISIVYPKPTVRRSQAGIFNKEDTNVFLRTMTITNTKHNAAVELTVLDQVPVSEDERLKIEITNPRGLRPSTEGVRTGQGFSNGSSAIATAIKSSTLSKGTAKEVRASASGVEAPKETKWGSAVASARKGGEIAWAVKLNPGQGVKLTLEYEANFPTGEHVVVH